MIRPVQELKNVRSIGATAFMCCALLVLPACNWVSLIAVTNTGELANGSSSSPSLSADGRYAAFRSTADNLVPDDTNGQSDVFVRDFVAGTIRRVSVDSLGNQSNDSNCCNVSISGDGRYVAFESDATNLVANANPTRRDVFVHDLDTGITTLVSVDTAGNAANNGSSLADISFHGRYILFHSFASDLVAGDTNGSGDAFVRDQTLGTTTRVSVDSVGNQADLGGSPGGMSPDGRFVSFNSASDDLVADDTNSEIDTFFHDRNTGATSRISVDRFGNNSNDNSSAGRVSESGRYVVFSSYASDLVAGDSNNDQDVFVRDRNTGNTSRVSVSSTGEQGLGNSYVPSITHDGRYVLFQSTARNLVPDDTNFYIDIFLHDRVTGLTSRVSESPLGNPGNGNSNNPVLSYDGRYAAFNSFADNLVSTDTNGTIDAVIRALRKISVTSVVPHMLPIGATTSVTITGAHFQTGSQVALAADVSNMVVVDENTITVDITVPEAREAGAANLMVTLEGTGPGAFTGAAGICTGCVTFF